MKKVITTSIIALFVFICSVSMSSAGSGDINLEAVFGTSPDAQKWFDDLGKEIGLIISYTPLSPAEPLGILGFDVGVEVTGVKISSDAAFWENAIDDTPPDYIVLPKIHAQKGLPFGIDVGAVYALAPGTNISLYGAEIKWAVLKGSIVTPAAAIRGNYTALAGVDDLDVSTYGVDASVSKGFGPLTPYAGLGQIWISASENVPSPVDLKDVSTSATKFFLGTKIKLLLLSIVLEADFSDISMYSARANVSF